MKWITTIVIAAHASAFAADLSAEEMAVGQKIYQNKCARCHKFYDPTSYDDQKWDLWMDKMRRKAHLNDTQYQQLYRYLQSVRGEGPQQIASKAP